ncbi:alcohol dehydrogenase catalytic domain-containing protein [Cellulomonas sp. JZ18]|uniref:zinc-dependent alcohol dehydrogenase family protein n=1 Tax=Cellulomonas sp. JZ18 TaxID=2654191 RepID=UPI0012D390BB|nr:zinc-dependent alcohol dehydrogenase family protein [Cellulomonas sp. JZ18]QGQ19073.1 alcohol dehydrogenase catalytic domain-containing protein [Cellulomonas sp. JZ18]
MRATVLHGPRDVRVEQVPDPEVRRPTDAVVRVVASCVCGSDLWPYRGVREVREPRRMGHEFVGVVEEVGADVARVKVGDFVVAPFVVSDDTCVHCRNGVHTSCVNGAGWGGPDRHGDMVDGGQGEYVRVPFADGTLVVTPEHPDEALLPHVLTLTDVMGTGHHAALAGGVRAGSTVAVVGDGAVGLCAVIAARRLGAERVVALSRHEARAALAVRFGATDVVAERGDEGAAAVRDLLGGVGPDAVLECVGTKESMQQSLDTVRPGGRVGYVGVPAGGPELPIGQMFGANIGVLGGVAPVRAYVEGLLPDVWAGTIEPGLVFDGTFALDDVADAYRAMDERTVTKSLVLP